MADGRWLLHARPAGARACLRSARQEHRRCSVADFTEAIAKASVADLEEAVRQGYKQGYKDGYEDGYRAGLDDGYNAAQAQHDL